MWQIVEKLIIGNAQDKHANLYNYRNIPHPVGDPFPAEHERQKNIVDDVDAAGSPNLRAVFVSYIKINAKSTPKYSSVNKLAGLSRVEEDQFYSGEVYHVTVTPWPSGPVWKEEIPEVEDPCRVAYTGGMLFRAGEVSFYEEAARAVDSTFFGLFSFPLKTEDPAKVLCDPLSVVITEETAEKYFGKENPIGKSLTVNNQYEFTVSGILQKPPDNSIVNFQILIPFEFMKETGRASDSWGNNSISTYLMLHPNAINDSVIAKPVRITWSHNEGSDTQFMVAPMVDIHLHAYFGYGHDPGGIIYVYIFSAIVIFVLLIVSSVLPVFNTISGKHPEFSSPINLRFILSMLAVTLLAGFISGVYPALYLSAFKPIRVLKADLSSGMRSGRMRKILVIVRFTLSVFLISCLIAVPAMTNPADALRYE